MNEWRDLNSREESFAKTRFFGRKRKENMDCSLYVHTLSDEALSLGA